MQISQYDDVDPLEVLHLNLLCLDFALTPARVAQYRRLDPRPFPFFGVYAQERGTVTGQVGVFRLPVVSQDGAQEVGGVWAVATHPAFAGRGVAAHLLDEAHARMRSAGLHYSTLGTQRYRVAYSLYRRLGYEDVFVSASMLARRETLPKQTEFKAEQATGAALHLADQLFERVARAYLGYARRHTPFFAARAECGDLAPNQIWLLRQGDESVGYAVASHSKGMVHLNNLLLLERVDPVAAVATLVHALDAQYVWVRVDRPAYQEHLTRAGFLCAQPDWNVFMAKPLVAQASVAQFRQQYGLTADRFLVSYLDIT